MTVATNTALAKIGAGVESFAFSATTGLIVPGLTDTSQLISGPIAEIPAEHHRFRELCGSVKSPYCFDTRWGRAEVEIYGPELADIYGSINTSSEDRLSFELMKNTFRFLMRERHIEARLDYSAGSSQLFVSQGAGVPYDKDDSNYHERIAIIANAEMLRIAGKMEENKEHPAWQGILSSIQGDRVTPLTAYHLGSILNDQLFSECGIPQMIYAALNHTKEDNFQDADFFVKLYCDICDGVTRDLQHDIKGTFVSGNQTREVFRGLQGYEILITDSFVSVRNVCPRMKELSVIDDSLLHGAIIMYTPPNIKGKYFSGLRNGLNLETLNAPTIIIVQNVQAGAPYAPIVGDLLRAAKIMRPDFPLKT